MPVHQPFWCEENIWHLAVDATVGAGERLALVLTGAAGHVACWEQHAAAAGEPVLWDYHVVLAAAAADGWRIWDLDTRLGCPLAASAWLAGTFPAEVQVPDAYAPRFLAVPAEAYRRDLWSDRAHMRRPDGGWQQPPPGWPPPLAGTVPLADYLRRARAGLTLDALRRRLERGAEKRS